MTRQEEFDLREGIYEAMLSDVNKQLDTCYEKVKNSYKMIVVYPLAVLEQEFKNMSYKSIEKGLDNFEALIIVNPLREAVYWFVREMCLRQKDFKAVTCKINYEAPGFGKEFKDFVLSLHDKYLKANQIRQMRSSTKVILNELKSNPNHVRLLFPTIEDSYDKGLIYYYGLDDASRLNDESEIVIESEKFLVDNFFPKEFIESKEEFNSYIRAIELLETKINIIYYELCKKRVSIDIDKIAHQLSSSIIKNREELISVVAFFYYLSRICMQKYSLTTLFFWYSVQKNQNYCYISRKKLNELAKQVCIEYDVLESYINYFSMDINLLNGNFTEFPLIVVKNMIIWIPSSFVLNDYQFSVVNGHYYKNEPFIKKEETVSQSIIDYIIKAAQKYSNIICANNYIYNEPAFTYDGKVLQSDIDVALYDKMSNSLIIIECKWKENVYKNRDDYLQIERAIKEIYKKQLDKHEYYLGINPDNYNKLFKNKVNISSKLDSLNIIFLFVDKRIQFHENTLNRHAVPIFMLAYLFDIYSDSRELDLRGVIKDINDQKSNIKYQRKRLLQPVKIGDKTII